MTNLLVSELYEASEDASAAQSFSQGGPGRASPNGQSRPCDSLYPEWKRQHTRGASVESQVAQNSGPLYPKVAPIIQVNQPMITAHYNPLAFQVCTGPRFQI